MKKDTGLMLSEAQGPLQKLIENLSGKHGSYWIEALKKMLRKEQLPIPPIEVTKKLDALRISAKEKLEMLAEYIRSIPVIHEVTVCDIDEDGDLLNINVLPNLRSFIEGKVEDGGDSPYFFLKKDHKVYAGQVTELDFTDKTFDKFCLGKNYENIFDFCNAMIELGKKYEESVPKVPV